MQLVKLNEMVGGWFVGNFSPSLMRTPQFEVAVKHYRAGESEPSHHHKAAEEITVIASGRAKMCGRQLAAGDMVKLERGESTSFEAIEDTITVVVKSPSVTGDKYLD